MVLGASGVRRCAVQGPSKTSRVMGRAAMPMGDCGARWSQGKWIEELTR
jgi:hypothetical protein